MSARTSTVRPGRPPSRVATAPVGVGHGSGVRPSPASRSLMAAVVVCSANATSGWACSQRRVSIDSSSPSVTASLIHSMGRRYRSTRTSSPTDTDPGVRTAA